MEKIKVLIDCDTGIDDIVALSYALKTDRLEVLGVTTVCGNLPVDITTYNTLNALELMGRPEIPLAKGAATPLERPLWDAAYIHGSNGLGGYEFAHKTAKQPEAQPAHEFIYSVLMAQPEPITIIALAPLTNIALLLKEHPDALTKIQRIVFMGGSLRTGNPTPVATFNVLADPEAAKYVIATKVPFVMCSLDCTRGSFLTYDDLDKVAALHNPVADMVRTVTGFYIQTTKAENTVDGQKKGIDIHDLCTVMYVTHPELFEGEHYFADVETKGELTTGFTLVDFENNLKKPPEDKTVLFLKKVDREKYVEYFLEVLARYEA